MGIVNIASGVAKVPAGQLWLPYSCSKGAVYTLTHASARALGPSAINVNAIAPELTASEASLAQRDSEKTFEIVALERPIQQFEEPTDLVRIAVFLASTDSDFITGQVIYVDSGIVIAIGDAL